MERAHLFSRREALKTLTGSALAVAGRATAAELLLAIFRPRLAQAVEAKPATIDFQNYAPPPEGVVIKKKFVDPSKKTVLWMGDVHTSRPDVDAANVHMEQLRVLQDLLHRGIKIPQVVESYIVGENFDDFVARQRTVENPSPEFQAFFALLDIPNIQERRKFAEEHVIGKNQIITPLLAKALYPDQMDLIGTNTREELQHSIQLQRTVTTLIARVKHEALCFAETGVQDNPMTWKETQRSLPTPHSQDCYCGIRRDIREAAKSHKEYRQIVASKREIQAAMAHEGSNFVFVHAGILHAHTAIEELEKAGVNYFIIAPRSAEQLLLERLKNSLDAEVSVKELPDKDGICDRWEKTPDKQHPVKWIP